MNPAFWKDKQVFVTGHTGFKGSWLCLWLERMGAQVTGYALAPPTEPSLFQVADVAAGMTSLQGDIRDLAGLSAAMAEAAPDVVLHLAAQSLVRPSYDDPVGTYATNVMGTVNVLEAVRRTPGVRVVVNVTSDKCYENREWPWGYRENEAMGGHDPYSSSKGCAELVAAAYRRSFFEVGEHAVALASARAGNVIGGGDWAVDRLVPDVLKAFGEGRPVQLRSPTAVRPWQHVLEPVHGYLLLAERLWSDGPAHAGGWNFGPSEDDARPVSWIVEQLADCWGEGASWGQDEGQHPHEAHYLKLDCSKARSQLQWQPRWSLAKALEQTVAWYRAYLAGEDMRTVSEAQIALYEGGQQA